MQTTTADEVRSLYANVLRALNVSSKSVAGRINASVARPLRSLMESRAEFINQPRTDATADPASEYQMIAHLADQATMLSQRDDSAELFEAAAALQELACNTVASGDAVQECMNRLGALVGEARATIRLAPNGPILVRNVTRLVNWLGEPLPAPPLMALCRCGASAMKPYCDGSHAESKFSDGKDPGRLPDRRETYIGEQVTILDNRGTCQHSGFCTERLPTVFHQATEPFVTASGGRMDEIIRAVRDCPSGALSFSIDGVEARETVDFHGTRLPTIEVTKDGPYRITGGIAIEEADGSLQRNIGASREHFTLCRCGRARNKPFCTGMHWYVQFRDPVPDPDAKPTIFEWAGGLPALTRMTRIFYEKYVPQDELLAPLFAEMSADHPERVAKWLAEVFCGPHYYSEQFGGYPRMLSQHLGKCITEEMRARWVALLLQSAKDAGLPNDPEFAAAFQSYISWGSRLALENSQTNSRPPATPADAALGLDDCGRASRKPNLGTCSGDDPEFAPAFQSFVSSATPGIHAVCG